MEIGSLTTMTVVVEVISYYLTIILGAISNCYEGTRDKSKCDICYEFYSARNYDSYYGGCECKFLFSFLRLQSLCS